MFTDTRILIADDDAELRSGAAELLDSMGLEVLHAGSGREALDVYSSSTPLHLTLLDVHMPDRGGLDIFQAMQALTPDIPCILWSGEATEAYEQSALRAGISAFLRKPVRPEILRDEVQRVLTHRWGSLS